MLLCHSMSNVLLAEMVWHLRTQVPTLRWLPDDPTKDEAAKSCWLLLCNHQEPSVADVLATINANGWSVAESDVHLVPPENGKMATVYCRKVRVVRP